MPHVEQKYTNIMIWRETRFQPLFRTNSLLMDQSNIKYLIWIFVAVVSTGKPKLTLNNKGETI
jgi:hypothetical protein